MFFYVFLIFLDQFFAKQYVGFIKIHNLSSLIEIKKSLIMEESTIDNLDNLDNLEKTHIIVTDQNNFPKAQNLKSCDYIYGANYSEAEQLSKKQNLNTNNMEEILKYAEEQGCAKHYSLEEYKELISNKKENEEESTF